MIKSVATFSLHSALRCISRRWTDPHPFGSMRRAWVGFETCAADRSPLWSFADGASLVLRCRDWDVDGRHSPAQVGPVTCHDAPTLDHARQIVAFVLDLHRSPDEYALAVHCHAGLFRSGAVAEWVRSDLGVAEHECSNRNVNVIGDTAEQHIYNIALLRLIRQAHAEATP